MPPTRGSVRPCIAALVACLALPAAARAAGPDFDVRAWRPLGCDTPQLVSPASPSSVSFAGDHANPPAFYAYDADYLYFRYRMDSNPASGGKFAQYVWTALVQVPSGDPFRYQYQLSLDGKSDTIEIWGNTAASEVRFPNFHDDSEVQLYSVPVGSLARTVAAGTSFNGGTDWFVDFAFPVAALIEKGVVASAGDLARTLFFPATSTNPNNYNKSFLNCSFQPAGRLEFSKIVTPTVALADRVTPVTYTIAVQNTGATAATGVVVEDVEFPAFLGNVAVDVTTDDPQAVVSAVSQNPLLVKSTTLGAGRRLTVVIAADAYYTGCKNNEFVNTASGRSTNTLMLQASATVGSDVCDGVDNDCDGQADEGTSLCDDHDACTVDTCGGESGCSHEPIPGCVCTTAADCNDGDLCTVDRCSGGACVYAPSPDCTVSCTTAADCADGDPCTTETCTGGVCGSQPAQSCAGCTTAADCDDADPCTVDVCGSSGSCELTAVASCRPCATAADCDDANACTADVCAGGVCEARPIDGCTADQPGGGGSDGGGGGTGTGDCAGGDCSQAPGHVVEICGDCQDNDADGLADYEDPDCCERTDPLTLGQMVMRMRPNTAHDRLRLRSRPSAGSTASLDPVRDGVTLQLSDRDGRLYCHDLALVGTRGGRSLFRFRDEAGNLAEGLQRARLKIRKDGRIVFRATGGKMNLRTPEDSGVRVTLRVGGQCMQTNALLRSRPAKLGTRNTYP